MKKFLALISTLILLSACEFAPAETQIKTEDQPVQTESVQTPTVDITPLPPTTVSPKTVTFDITAKDWAFSPSNITVNEGDTIIMNITSKDIEHGISIPDFGINQKLSPDQTVTVQFVADKKGSFSFFCNVPCGEGHKNMVGTITVQ